MFGDLDWDSNRFHTDVAAFILEKGYGCEVDRIPGSTTPLITALGKGDIDVVMEVWKQNILDAWGKLEKEGAVKLLGVNFPDAVQGFYVPTYMIKGDQKRGIKPTAPELKSVFDLKKYKQLFSDPEQPEKGRFYNCILGWSCEDVNTKKLKAYQLEEDFTNFKPGTGAALAAAIAAKYERGEPFLSYYWGPTWILGKYDLTLLEEPAYDEKIWKAFNSGEDPSKAVEYPVIKIYIGANVKWANANPEAVSFLKKYRTSNKLVSQALAYMQEKEGRSTKDAALHFLKTKTDLWKSWVPENVFEKLSYELGIQADKKEEWKLDIAPSINKSVSWIVKNYSGLFRSISKTVLALIIFVEKILFALPWWAFSLAFAVLAFWVSGLSLTAIVFACLVSIKALGLWTLAMQSLSLMLISTLFAILFGLPVGILSSKKDKFRSLTLPILDAMQTMPSFVYLIPALMLFGLGKVPAVFATVIYAIVPIIRLTDLGIRNVDKDILEAADAFGASSSQKLLKVELPLALPTIMAGLNQTIMMALSMVVIASMIGARGLGEQVLLGIQKLDVGQGFTAGLAIVFLAIVLDRITQDLGKKMDRTQ